MLVADARRLGHAKRLHRRVQLAAQLQQLLTLDAAFTDAGQVVAAQVVDARRPKSDAPQTQDAGGRHWPRAQPGTLLGSLLTGCGALWMLALE